MQTNNIYAYRLFALCFLSVTLGALNSVLSSAYLPDIIQELSTDTKLASTGWIGSWINFAFLAGGSIGGISLGFLSDRIGRKTGLLTSLTLYGLGSGFGAWTGSWEMLALTRVIVGAGVGSALVMSAVIISEAWDKNKRAIALGILSVAYPVGIILSGLITSSVKEWRIAFLLGSCAMLLTFPVWYWIQEPKQRQHEVGQQLKLRDFQPELLNGILVYGSMLIGLWATFSWLPTWVQSLLEAGDSDGQSKRGLTMGLLGGGGLAGGMVSGFLSNRFGSKVVQATCFVSCLLVSCFLFQFNHSYSLRVTIGIAVLGICFGISQGVLNDYIPKLFPNALRSSATGLCFHVGRAFTAVAVFFVGAFVVWFGGYGNAIFAFSTVYLLGLVSLLYVRSSKSPHYKIG